MMVDLYLYVTRLSIFPMKHIYYSFNVNIYAYISTEIIIREKHIITLWKDKEKKIHFIAVLKLNLLQN